MTKLEEGAAELGFPLPALVIAPLGDFGPETPIGHTHAAIAQRSAALGVIQARLSALQSEADEIAGFLASADLGTDPADYAAKQVRQTLLMAAIEQARAEMVPINAELAPLQRQIESMYYATYRGLVDEWNRLQDPEQNDNVRHMTVGRYLERRRDVLAQLQPYLAMLASAPPANGRERKRREQTN